MTGLDLNPQSCCFAWIHILDLHKVTVVHCEPHLHTTCWLCLVGLEGFVQGNSDSFLPWKVWVCLNRQRTTQPKAIEIHNHFLVNADLLDAAMTRLVLFITV